jgi:hypothetical protein
VPKRKREYPELVAVGCAVKRSSHGYEYVRGEDLLRAMRAKGLEYSAFEREFGVGNTCPMEGMFAWDAEAALRRVRTGEKEHWMVWD